MKKITIQWLSDEYDCEDTCGTSYAEGARVYKDDELLFELKPVAHCHGGQSWCEREVYDLILSKLGYEAEHLHE